jgi:hypothetical protein
VIRERIPDWLFRRYQQLAAAVVLSALKAAAAPRERVPSIPSKKAVKHGGSRAPTPSSRDWLLSPRHKASREHWFGLAGYRAPTPAQARALIAETKQQTKRSAP